MIKESKKISFVMIICSLLSCSGTQPLKTVKSVDINKYMGKWYEIATIPQRFQKGCNCTTAEYSLVDNKYVKVVNTCKKGSDFEIMSQIEGKAFVSKKGNGAKLKVQFFWPIKAKYWIIDLADDYSWAVVGHPNRKYLWILSRTPNLNQTIYNGIISRLQEQKYDTSLLVKTNQSCNETK